MLLIGSYVFYGWWDVHFLFLVLLSTAIDFYCGAMIDTGRLEFSNRRIVSLSVVLATVRTVFYEGSGEESYPGLKVQSDSKKDCAMDSLQNILTDALTTVGHFTNRNEPFSSHS